MAQVALGLAKIIAGPAGDDVSKNHQNGKRYTNLDATASLLGRCVDHRLSAAPWVWRRWCGSTRCVGLPGIPYSLNTWLCCSIKKSVGIHHSACLDAPRSSELDGPRGRKRIL